MPQNSISNNSVTPAGALTTNKQTAGGDLAVQVGGQKSALNVTAAAVVKASAGVLHKIVVVAPGSAGSLTINDLAATTGGAAGNEIMTIGYAALSVGQVIVLDWPCATGIAVTVVPSAGSPVFSISYS